MFRSDLHAAHLHVDKLHEENEALRRALAGKLPKPKSRVGFSVAVTLASLVAITLLGAGALYARDRINSGAHIGPISLAKPEGLPMSIESVETKVLTRGYGDAVVGHGSRVKLDYEGQLMNGVVFDSTKERQPFEFVVGKGAVIPGLDQGVMGMKKGESARSWCRPTWRTVTRPSDRFPLAPPSCSSWKRSTSKHRSSLTSSRTNSLHNGCGRSRSLLLYRIRTAEEA
jgi:hypothetical protein